ncbi:MAG TPA: ACT domain-containing protein, partial [Candidatus Methylacidiphilales bacterium]
PGTAALAGEQVASEYGLSILRRDVQEAIANRTKFYVIGAPLADSRPASHTSLVFEAAHRPGSLVVALNALAARGLNLTMIQSRPIPGRFDEYRFLIEFENGGREQEALLALRGETDSLSLLGSYPIVNLSSSTFIP